MDHCGERTPQATKELSGLEAEKRVRGSLRGAERSRSFLRTCPAATKTRGQGEQRGVRECAAVVCVSFAYPLLLEVEDEPLDQGAALLQFDFFKPDVDLFECVLVGLL